VVADFERAHDGDFATLLGLVDHLIVPVAFAAALTGSTDPAEAASLLLEPARAAVVVTDGRAAASIARLVIPHALLAVQRRGARYDWLR